MGFIESLKDRAKSLKKKIAFPESTDERVLKAVRLLKDGNIVEPILIGDYKEIGERAKTLGIRLDDISIFSVSDDKTTKDFAALYLERMKARGITEEEAVKKVKEPLYSACLFVKARLADGVVSGATWTTSDSIRAYLQCFGPGENVKTVSSFFIIISPKKEFGENGVMLYADCGVVPYPDYLQLAEISIQSSKSFKLIVGAEPRVALLSFSTKGSARGLSVDKIHSALATIKERSPSLAVDGELQADAAIVPSIGLKKAHGSSVAGKANVLIFPDLDSGNIAYKISERLGGCTALGPILQGIAKPANDLSRGCSTDDILLVSAITAIQASI